MTAPAAEPRGDAPPPPPPLTKIVATVGPASGDDERMLDRLVECGVSVFRLNFSHGTLDEHAARLGRIRAAGERAGRPVAVLGDLQGPKIRVGDVPREGIEVAVGDRVVFQRAPIRAEPGPPPRFSCTYAGLVDDVRPGERLLVADGAVRMLVLERGDDEIACRVTQGGRIHRAKGINLPESTLRVEVIGPHDERCAAWAVEAGLDFLALSFVGAAADVLALRDLVAREAARRGLDGLRLPIVAKIERPAAVDDIEAIVDAADAIMVARGDLGVEMDLAAVPVVQKQLIRTAESWGKPCIVATQMLETMIDSPQPTRAEASDVAGAIFEHVDAVMLSGETAVGAYPALTVDTMRRIARYTEAAVAAGPDVHRPPARLVESGYRTAALAHGVWHVAKDIGAAFIVVWSQAGGGARYLSQHVFDVPILAVSSDERALRQMQLLRGVTPVRMPRPDDLAHFTQMVNAYLLETGWAEAGEPCVLVAGEPIGVVGVTNRLAIHTLGDPTTGYAAAREPAGDGL